MDGEGAEDSGFVEVEMQVAPFRAFTSSHRNLCLIPRNDIENPLSMWYDVLISGHFKIQ